MIPRIAITLVFTISTLSTAFASAITASADPLQRLVAGNARFVSGEPVHPHQSSARRAELTTGQKPFAVVLTCADSRVAPEIYFDLGLGDIFVLRNAGNIVDENMLGSIEYAVEHLGSSLVVVVGHSKCGAVGAAVAGGEVPGHIAGIVRTIAPSVAAAANSAEPVEAAVRANAERMAATIASTGPILSEAVKKGHLRVAAARYDLATGVVEFFDAPAAAKLP
jgi:carbonic anhydrase